MPSSKHSVSDCKFRLLFWRFIWIISGYFDKNRFLSKISTLSHSNSWENRIKWEFAYTRSKLDLECPIILLYTFKIQFFQIMREIKSVFNNDRLCGGQKDNIPKLSQMNVVYKLSCRVWCNLCGTDWQNIKNRISEHRNHINKNTMYNTMLHQVVISKYLLPGWVTSLFRDCFLKKHN